MPIDIKGNKRDASIYWQKILDYSVKLSEISKIKLCEKSTKCAIFLAKNSIYWKNTEFGYTRGTINSFKKREKGLWLVSFISHKFNDLNLDIEGV